MTRPPLVVGIGEALWDTFPEGSHFGGASANFAVHVASLRGKASLVSSLGKDELGERGREFLSRRGVDISQLQTHPTRRTGEVLIELNEECIPTFRFQPEPAWGELEESPGLLDLAANCDAVNFGTLGQSSPQSRTVTQNFLRNCNPGCLRLFDMNLRGEFWSPDVIWESLELASALKCNEDEITELGRLMERPLSSHEEILCEVQQRFELELVAFTHGSKGSFLRTSKEQHWLPAVATQVVDTTGAGDSFLAALVAGFLARRPLVEIHHQAAAIASYVCSQQGATPSLPPELVSSAS